MNEKKDKKLSAIYIQKLNDFKTKEDMEKWIKENVTIINPNELYTQKIIQIAPTIDLKCAEYLLKMDKKKRNKMMRKALYNIEYNEFLGDLFKFLKAQHKSELGTLLKDYVNKDHKDKPCTKEEFIKFLENLDKIERSDYE